MILCSQTGYYFERICLVRVFEERIVTFANMEYQKNLLNFYGVYRKAYS